MALSDTSCSRYSLQASSITCRTNAAMIGKISTACATIIAAGVNRIPREPNGPARDSSRYTNSPTTTGGRPIKPFSNAITPCRPGKRASASQAPRGSASSEAISTATPDTRNDNPAIDSKVLSSEMNSDQARERLCGISCMRCVYRSWMEFNLPRQRPGPKFFGGFAHRKREPDLHQGKQLFLARCCTCALGQVRHFTGILAVIPGSGRNA